MGNLTWLLYYYWQYCVGYGDEVELRTRFFPLLKSAVNLFFHIRTCNNGRYGLPATASPEYLSGNIGPNTNYDLANLRWGLKTLVEIDTTYRINDPQLADWIDFQQHLTDYPYSEQTGYKLSDKYEFADTSHRHYSHLFMIYPYYLVNWENPAHRERIKLSVGRWKGNQGYSRTGKAAMLLSMGDGDGALEQMKVFFGRFLKPNTLYAESGPVIETPMAAMSTLHEFYMQDWGERIRVFYGMPAAWADASFVNLRAKGAFLVSATRKAGQTVFIQVESEKCGLCRLRTGMPVDRLAVTTPAGREVPFRVTAAEDGTIAVETRAGDVFQVTRRDCSPALPEPVSHPAGEAMSFGDGSRM